MNNAVILAGGQGKRMKSQKPKALTEILGKPILGWIISALENAGIENICVVTGFASQYIEEYLGGKYETVFQSERLGTGHAVMTAASFLERFPDGNTLIFNGDAPFVDSETVRRSLEYHVLSENSVTVITAEVDEPYGYGRIIRTQNGISGIREQKDCSPEEAKIREINSGCFWFNTKALLETLPKLDCNNAQGEYYITDTVEILLSEGQRAGAYAAENQDIVLSANDRKGMLMLNDIARKRVLEKHLDNGVEIVCSEGIIISPDAQIAPGVKILPNTLISGKCIIGAGAVIGPNCQLNDTVVGERSVLNSVVANGATVGSDCNIGPFVQLRPNAVIKDFVHIGDFVEIKNSVIGEGTSVSHFNYVGDSDVGKNVNFGCGSLTANYDGTNKYRTEIGDDAFIGCNTNLVAPVRIGNAAYTAAGSTITKEVPDGALGIGRSRQENKEGYAEKKLTRHLEKGKKFK